ncbi:alpha,alpha-trehalose-phosphate synthase (UDP-forming) [Persephonella sp.]
MERLLVVSAILPVHITKENGDISVKVSPGGLVTALKQVLQNKKAVWIGWAGVDRVSPKIREVIHLEGKKEGFLLYPVALTREERENFFDGFSNGIIWPLFHTFQAYARFQPEYWKAYVSVNRKFAGLIKKVVSKNDFIWVHDYHFFLLPEYLKKAGVKNKTAFFLHIPFPPPEMFFKIPWRVDMLRGLLEYDLIGFHTFIDRKNFLECVSELTPVKNVNSEKPVVQIKYKNRRIKVGVFPISIDFDRYNHLAQNAKKPDHRTKIILGIDRLDYTKGLVQKLKAYRYFLEKYPQYHCKVKLVQAVAPNIKKLPEYDRLKVEFEHLVSEINGTFGTDRWTPVHYIYGRIPEEKLIGYYRYADICWVNSVKDGMNLVGKEYAASNIDETGVLLLSEFAGAATEIGEYTLLVNPYDIEGTASAIYRALTMPQKEKKSRMKQLRDHIRRYNIKWWGNCILQTAFGKKIEDFPFMENEIPLHETL